MPLAQCNLQKQKKQAKPAFSYLSLFYTALLQRSLESGPRLNRLGDLKFLGKIALSERSELAILPLRKFQPSQEKR